MTISVQPTLLGRFFGAFWPYLRVSSLADLLLMWQERASQRYILERLEERDLADIGITREQAAAEIRKPFWRA